MSNSQGFHLSLQPAPAWTAILSFFLFSGLGILAGAGSIIRLVFPAGSLVVGGFLYWRYPILYIGFTWWLWFLTPLFRRLVDYRSGWVDPSPMLLSPYLVTGITLITFLKFFPKSHRINALPFALAGIGVFYGFLIGLVKTTPMTAFRSLLDWLTPIAFGFYLFVNWQEYPSYRQNIQRVFLWGVLVTGCYGIFQYLVAPEWDKFWLINTQISSFGDPEPLSIRVWSTMNSPGPFASMMMAGLLLLFNSKHALKIPAAMSGYLAFLLSLVRITWIGWFVGFITLASSLKTRLQIRLIITILMMAIFIMPLITIEPFSDRIFTRLQTLNDLEKDNSATVRKDIYADGINQAFSNVLGNGIGNTFILEKDGILRPVVIDSGILDIFFTLGWLGGIPYLGAMIMMLFSSFQYSEFRFDPFMCAARAITVGSLATMGAGSAMLGPSGILLWGFLSLVMAGHKYHQYCVKKDSTATEQSELKKSN
jgi:hypothetical protein